MGEVVLAAKVTHVPSIVMSEPGGPLEGRRAEALASLHELGRRARARGVQAFLVFDTHWLSNFGCHINANARHRGVYTSREAPHMIQDLSYDHPGNPALAQLIAEEAAVDGLDVRAHQVATLGLEYGTVVPMRYMNADGACSVVPVAAPLFATLEENRRFGAAARRAIERSPFKVAALASGSLSHKLVANAQVGDAQWDRVGSEFNRQMDLRVLELWRQRRYGGVHPNARRVLDQVQRRSLDGRHPHAVRAAGLGRLRRRSRGALRLFPVERQRTDHGAIPPGPMNA